MRRVGKTIKNYQISKKVRDQMSVLIRQAEAEFVQTIEAFPYCVVVSSIPSMDDRTRDWNLYMDEKLDWLKENIHSDFLAFPDCCGVYKHCWKNVYFKNDIDAIMFKLTL